MSDDLGSSDARTIPIQVSPLTPFQLVLNGHYRYGLLVPKLSNDNNTGVNGYWDGSVENADYGWNVTAQETPNREISQSLQFKVEDSALRWE